MNADGGAAMGRLPTELLVLIFCELHSLRRSGALLELVLASVCRRWRDVAMDMPLLWTEIRVPFPLDAYRKSIAESYIERSKGCPLDIRIILHRGCASGRFPLLNMASHLNTIYPYVDRWKTLHVDAHCINDCHLLLDNLRQTFVPLLEHLRLCCGEWDPNGNLGFQDQDDDDLEELFQGGAPSLKYIQLRGISLQETLPPSSTVETLHIHTAPKFPVHPFLYAMLANDWPSLTHLVIHGYITDIDFEFETRTLMVFPSLITFQLLASDEQSSAQTEILEHIDVPKL